MLRFACPCTSFGPGITYLSVLCLHLIATTCLHVCDCVELALHMHSVEALCPNRVTQLGSLTAQMPDLYIPTALLNHTYPVTRAMHLPRKVLIQMSGAPGSGKSTLANLLSQSIDGVVINHDLIKSFFLENDILFEQSAKLTYRFDWILAEDMIKQGRNVIIDSTCNYIEVLDQGTALARQYGYDYKYVECRVADIDLLDYRLRNRAPLRSQRTGVDRPPPDVSGALPGEDYRALFKRWIEYPCRPADAAIVVDSTRNPEECLEYLMRQFIPASGVETN